MTEAMNKKARSQLINELNTLNNQSTRVKRTIDFYMTKIAEANMSIADTDLSVKEIEEALSELRSTSKALNQVRLLLSDETENFDEAINEDLEYIFKVAKVLHEHKSIGSSDTGSASSLGDSANHPFERLSVQGPRVPTIEITPFHGNQGDVIAFQQFITQFRDVVGNRPDLSDATKLIYLKSYLRSSALDVIKHLSNEGANLPVAIEFLEKEYLDQDVLIDALIGKIVDLPSPRHNDLDSIRSLFNELRNYVYDLKNLNLNPLQENSLGCKMISFLILRKLPNFYKAKFAHFLQTDFPTTLQLIQSFNEILKSLHKTAPHFRAQRGENDYQYNTNCRKDYRQGPSVYGTNYRKVPTFAAQSRGINHSSHKNESYNNGVVSELRQAGVQDTSSAEFSRSSLQNFQQTSQQLPLRRTHSNRGPKTVRSTIDQGSKGTKCRLCDMLGHSLTFCTRYKTSAEKLQQCRARNLCTYCTSGQHIAADCKGANNALPFKCSSCSLNRHITALCDGGI